MVNRCKVSRWPTIAHRWHPPNTLRECATAHVLTKNGSHPTNAAELADLGILKSEECCLAKCCLLRARCWIHRMKWQFLWQCTYKRLHQLLESRTANLTKPRSRKLLPKPCKAINPDCQRPIAIGNPTIKRIGNALKFLWCCLGCFVKKCAYWRQFRHRIRHAPNL